MAVNPASAAAYIVELLGLLAGKKKANESLLNSIKKKAKVIDGIPYIPTGFENKSPKELLNELNSAYGSLAPISFSGTNTNGLNLTAGTEDEDSIQISQTSSAAEIVPVTACPVDIPTVLPEYTKDEIQKVLEDVAKECDTRGVISPLIKGLGVKDVLDAKCDIVAPIAVGNAVFLDIAAAAPSDEKEPANALKKPTKTLVTLNSTKGLGDNKGKSKGVPVVSFKKEGDSVNCGDPILTIGNKTITSPSSGILRNLYVKDVASKNDRLFLIEETSPQDSIDKALKASDELGVKINQLSSLKEELGKIEPRTWVLKQIWGVYEGQYQGYISYYNKFNPLVKKLEDLNAEFKKNTESLKKIASATSNDIIAFSSLTGDSKKLVDRQKEIITEISNTTSQLDSIRKEQPLYFSLKSDSASLAAIKNGETTLAAGNTSFTTSQQYIFVPNKIGDKKQVESAKDINVGLGDLVKGFTNNILFNNRKIDQWNQTNLNINQQGLTYSNLRLVDPTNYALMFDDSGGNSEFWSGSMWQTRKNFVTKARNFGDEIKNISDTDLIEKKSEGLREEEKLLPSTIETLANKSFDAIVEYSKKYGYYEINVGSLFTTSEGNRETTLKKKRDDAEAAFQLSYAKYLDIRTKIDNVEKDIEEFPTKLVEILGGGCVLEGASQPTAANIDGEDVNLITWPVVESPPPKDDDNYKGNPQPNSPPVTDIKYWKKYCKVASTVNLLPLFWPIGLLIPTPGPLIKIPLPVIWKPLVVVPTPICLIVIGIDICGICPAPWVYIVNPGWPFPISLATPKSSWFLTGIRGPKKIDDETTSKPLAAIPTITIPLKYKQNGIDKQEPLTIDAAPLITKLLPLEQDDLPVYERLTLTNLPYISYLVKWCTAGKKTMGFFENP